MCCSNASTSLEGIAWLPAEVEQTEVTFESCGKNCGGNHLYLRLAAPSLVLLSPKVLRRCSNDSRKDVLVGRLARSIANVAA